MKASAIVAAGSAGVLLAAMAVTQTPYHRVGSTVPEVVDAVAGKLRDQLPDFTDQNRAITVTVTRRVVARWAFGVGVLRTPAGSERYPEGRLFLAEYRLGAWQVSLEGEPDFAILASRAPILESSEVKLLAATGPSADHANGDYRTGMRLPFTLKASWTFTGGPHGSPVRNAIDLAGGDQIVRAARAGKAYTMCRGWIRVIHDRGYATDYYHLRNHISANGTSVSSGTFLGYTGTDVTCGGSATGRHVHFGLRQNGERVPIARHIIGKWTPYNGSAEYAGHALHGSQRVAVGGMLYNYGPLGFTQGIVDTNGGGSLNRRSGPGTGYPVVGTVADGATVTVSCSRNGTSHTGRFGTTSLWNKLSDGTWISDAYLENGVSGPVNGWC